MRRSGAVNMGARPLAAGALLAALALVLGLAAYYLPLVGGVITFVMPLPVALAYLRYGWRLGTMTTAVAAVMALFVGGPLVGFFLATGCIIGLALGYGIRRQWPFRRTVLLATAVGLVTTVLGVVVSLLVIGPQFVQQSLDFIGEGMTLAAESLGAAGLNPEVVQEIQQTQSRLMASPVPFIAMSLLLGSFMYSMVWYAACAPALERLGHQVPRPGAIQPVAQWGLPPMVGLAMIVAYMVALLRGGSVDLDSPQGAYLRIGLSVIGLALTFQGLGLLAHLLTRARVGAAVRQPLLVFAGIGVFYVPPVSMLLFWMGMADVGLDIRGFARLGARMPGPDNKPEPNDSDHKEG